MLVLVDITNLVTIAPQNDQSLSTTPKVVACIPAYNEERTIASVIVRAKKYVDMVVVCDDGSTDMTGEISENLGAEVIRNERNEGKGVALANLLTRAKQLDVDVVVTLDADGQHDPEEIPGILEPIFKKEADVVIGSRYVSGSQTDPPFYRRAGLRLLNYLNTRGCSDVKDTQSGFRAFSKGALGALLQCEAKGYGIETEQLAIIAKESLRVKEVPISVHYKNLEKTSKKNPLTHGVELIGMTLRLVVEERPLFLLGVPGVTMILLGVSTGVLLLLNFNATRFFSIPLAFISLGAFFIGTLLFITSLILYAITRLKYQTARAIL